MSEAKVNIDPSSIAIGESRSWVLAGNEKGEAVMIPDDDPRYEAILKAQFGPEFGVKTDAVD